jgi:hypothetical protein
MNAVSSALGVQDYKLLADTILSGTDVILRYGKYGTDEKIFEKLDADERFEFTNIDSEENNERSIVKYSMLKIE